MQHPDNDHVVRQMFKVLVGLDASARVRWLREHGADTEVIKRVNELLDAVDPVQRPQPAGNSVGDSSELSELSRESTGERAGDLIGPYKLFEAIGEGGFGTVWLAERREPFVQRVALKIIKLGMDTKAVVARFEQERQALAVMNHPNVAKVFDAGTTPTGRPYFVMEHVGGESITTYCDRHRLSLRERLELFIPVCEAVQHAHHKGIIHRDIKPSNILVAVHEGRAVPKVIDFGIAKAVSHTLTQQTIFTEQGAMIGTPEYMSPEQAEMGATDVDTRTDVYALGVLLYELLSGCLPFDGKSLRSAGLVAVCRIIREQEPQRPSTRFATIEASDSAVVAASRQTQRELLARELRRELDWIPLKAIRKNRGERINTPNDLARDIQRYLDGVPILARKPTPWVQFSKLVRRSPEAAAGLALGAGLLATPWAFVPLWRESWRHRDVVAGESYSVSAAQYLPIVPMTVAAAGIFILVSKNMTGAFASLRRKCATTAIVWVTGAVFATTIYVGHLSERVGNAMAINLQLADLGLNVLFCIGVHPFVLMLMHRIGYWRAFRLYAATALLTILLVSLVIATAVWPLYLIFSAK